MVGVGALNAALNVASVAVATAAVTLLTLVDGVAHWVPATLAGATILAVVAAGLALGPEAR